MWKNTYTYLLCAAALAVVALLALPSLLHRDPEPPRAPFKAAEFAGPTVTFVVSSFVVHDHGEHLITELRLDDLVTVEVTAGAGQTLKQWTAARPHPPGSDLPLGPEKLIPYIHGIAIKGVYPSVENVEGLKGEPTKLHFRLARNDQNNTAWQILLGRPGSFGLHRDVSFTVGLENGDVISSLYVGGDTAAARVLLMQVSRWFWLPLLVLALAIAGFVRAARTTDLIRDTDCQPPPGKDRPFSLSRLQMAVWLFIVASAYMLIWLVTRDRSDLPTSVLTLIGISIGTAGGSLLIDANKRAGRRDLRVKIAALESRHFSLAERRAKATDPAMQASLDKEMIEVETELAIARKQQDEMPQPTGESHGFLNDILSDGTGVSLHRMQIAIWTIVLAFIFVVSVWRDLTMPDFSPSLLALMGISSGTYLGFKGNEK